MEDERKDLEPILIHTYKDSVFTHLFSIPEYTLQLYHVFHPEDQTVTIADIDHITHKNIIVKDIYNDLGFCVKDKLFILVESQSTWSLNIIVRAFLYLSRTYEDYLAKHHENLYGTRPVKLPEPELYVVYTKARKNEPDEISLCQNFFAGKTTAMDVKVKVLFGENRKDIIGQYVAFCQILDAQVNAFGPVRKALEEAIRICTEENILADYLKDFKLEVIKMTDYLFNEELIDQIYKESLREEARAECLAIGKEEGREEGRKEGREEGREEGRKEGREEGRKEGRQEGRQEGRKEGRKEGRQEGRKEGRQEGRKEGRMALLKELIANGVIGADQAEQYFSVV